MKNRGKILSVVFAIFVFCGSVIGAFFQYNSVEVKATGTSIETVEELPDIRGTTWYLNERIDTTSLLAGYFNLRATFDSFGSTWYGVEFFPQNDSLAYRTSSNYRELVYTGSTGFIAEEYRKLEFAGGLLTVEFSDDFVTWLLANAEQIYDGATSDLSDTVWTLSDVLDLPAVAVRYNIDFTWSSYEFVALEFVAGSSNEVSAIYFIQASGVQQDVYNTSRGWGVDDHNITITGGADVENVSLISWLYANSKQTTSLVGSFWRFCSVMLAYNAVNTTAWFECEGDTYYGWQAYTASYSDGTVAATFLRLDYYTNVDRTETVSAYYTELTDQGAIGSSYWTDEKYRNISFIKQGETGDDSNLLLFMDINAVEVTDRYVDNHPSVGFVTNVKDTRWLFSSSIEYPVTFSGSSIVWAISFSWTYQNSVKYGNAIKIERTSDGTVLYFCKDPMGISSEQVYSDDVGWIEGIARDVMISGGSSASKTSFLDFINRNAVLMDLTGSVGSGNADYDKGYNKGYNEGYDKGLQQGNSFVGLMAAVVEAPIKSFVGLMSFEVLGYDMKAVSLSLLTVALVVCLIRFFSKGSGTE